MDRRHFLRSLPVVSLILLTKKSVEAADRYTNPALKYLNLIGANPFSGSVMDDKELIALLESKAAGLTSLGYRLNSLGYKIAGKELLLAFRCELQPEEGRNLDECLLFFARDMHGDWEYVTTFNGFQLDALEKLGADNSFFLEKGGTASDYLIPAIRQSRGAVPGEIIFRKGKIHFQTIVGNAGITTKVTTDGKEQAVYIRHNTTNQDSRPTFC